MSDIFDTKNSQESENHAKGIEIGDEKYTKGDEIKSFENKVIQEKFNPITKEIKSICGNDERFEQLDLYKESGMTENDAIYKIGSEIYSDKIDEVTSILTEVFKEIIDISEDFKADCKKIYDSDLIASDKVKAVIDIMGKDEFKEKLSENEKLDFDKIADKIGGINIDLIEQLDSKLKNYESTKSDLEKLTDKFDKHLENYVNKTDFRSNNIFKAFDKFKVDCDAHKLKIEVNGKIPSRTDLVLDFISFVRCNIFESVIESALRGIFDTKPETDKVELSETEKNDISSSDSANKTDITSSDTEAVKEQLEVKVSEQNVEKSQTIEKRETILDNGTIMRGFSPNEIDKIKIENPRAGEMYGMDMLSAAKEGYIDKQGNEIIPAKTDRFAVAGISSDDTNKKYEVEIKLRNGETKTVKASPMNGYLAVDKESGNTYLLNHKLEVIEPINVVDNSKVLNNGDKIECRGKGAEIQASNIHFERYPDSVKSVAEIKDAIAKNDLSNVKEYISEAKEGIENVKEFKNELTEYKNVIEKTDNIDIQRKEKALSEINSNIEKCDVQISKYNTFIEKSEAFVKEPTFNNLQEVENSKTGFSHERFDAGIGMESRQTLIECNKINAETDQSIEKDQINNTETEKDEDKSVPTVDAEEQTNPDDSAKDETEQSSPVGTEEQTNPDDSAKDEVEQTSPVGTEEQTNPDDSAKDEVEQSSPVGTEEQTNPDDSVKDEVEQSSPVGTEEQINPDASTKDETEQSSPVDTVEQADPDASAKDETEQSSPVGTEEQANPDASTKDEVEQSSPVGTEEQTNPDASTKDEVEQPSPVDTEEQTNPDDSAKDEVEQSSPVGTEEQTNPDDSAKDETETVTTNNAKTDNKIEIDENYLKNDFPADLKADFEKYLSDDKMSFSEDIIDKYSQCFGIDETKSYEIMYDTFGKVLSEHKEDLSNPRMTDLGTDIMVCDKCSFMEAKDKIETLMFELPVSFNQKEDYFKNQFNKLETNIEIMQTRSDMSIFRFEYIDRNNEEHEVTIADNGYMDTNKDNIDSIDKQLFADVIDEKNADIHPLTLDSLKEAVVNIIAECYGNEVSKVFENVIDKLDTSELTGDIRPMIIKLGIAIDTVPDMVFKSEEKIENISSAEFMDKCVDKAQSDIDSISNNFLPGMWTFPYGSIDSRENQMDLQTAELENDRDEDPPERDAYDPVGYND